MINVWRDIKNTKPQEKITELFLLVIKECMRGFKSFESANAFLDLRRIIYNFVRGDETRAMKAGIALELGQNRLQGLIKF